MYTLIMMAAVGIGAIACRYWQSELPLDNRDKWGIGLGAFCGAMIGAKLPFVLVNWDQLFSGAVWFSDGKTIMCGLVGGYLGGEIAKWILDIRIKTGDSFAVPVALAVGIGRLACFAGSCCYGRPTQMPWGVVFPAVDAQPRHPTQLYESAFHLIAACVLAWLARRGMFRNQLLKLYIITYLVFRFFTEFIRPEPQVMWGLTIYQWAALVWLPLFVWLWRRDARALRCENSAPIQSENPSRKGQRDSDTTQTQLGNSV